MSVSYRFNVDTMLIYKATANETEAGDWTTPDNRGESHIPEDLPTIPNPDSYSHPTSVL